MFSRDCSEPSSVPSDVFLHVRSLCSVGQFSEALRALNERCSLNSRDEEAVKILANVGRTAVEEREYEFAYKAYLAAYDHARRAPRYGPVALLDVMCDAVELSTLAVDQSESVDTSQQRAALERALMHATAVPECDISPDLISKVIIAAGEVGSTQQIYDMLEDYCNGRDSRHLNSGANEGLFELLLGHEYVTYERLQASRLLVDAQEAYLNAYRKLQTFPEYAQLKSYALLCAARVAVTMRDTAGAELYLDESAREFVALPPQSRSHTLAARLLDDISRMAELSPHLRAGFYLVFEKTDLPVHYLISSLVRWSSPYCVNSRLKQAETPDQRHEILEDVRKMLGRAQLLVDDVMGVSNLDRVQLNISSCHMHLRDGDVAKAIVELRKGLHIAAVDPRGVDLVFPSLTQLAWDHEHTEHASELCSMYEELIQITPQSRACDEDIADFKFQLVVGLVNALSQVDYPELQEAQIMTRALKNLVVHLMRKQISPASEIYAFSCVLKRGADLVTALSPSQERGELLTVLRDLHEESLRRRGKIGTSDSEWLRKALEVEQSALVIYENLGESSRHAASTERLNRIDQELENRIVEGGEQGEANEDNFSDDWT
jgi:hypothetical protein